MRHCATLSAANLSSPSDPRVGGKNGHVQEEPKAHFFRAPPRYYSCSTAIRDHTGLILCPWAAPNRDLSVGRPRVHSAKVVQHRDAAKKSENA